MLDEIHAFLGCQTPQAWLDTALDNVEILLIDHANCEKKAAATAMNLMYRYVRKTELLRKMSQLAREELLHFEQVVNIMDSRGIVYRKLSPSRYAASLREHIRPQENSALVDTLIIGAFIEARSCERFAKLESHLDTELSRFYRSLLKSEARHYRDYLSLARDYSEEPIEKRVSFFAKIESGLVSTADREFRFHSGVI